MVTLKDNKISISKERTLSAKQINTLSRLTPSEKANYLATLLGLSKRAVYVPRLAKTGRDRLAEKAELSILHELARLTRTSNSHIPSNQDLGQWVGIEIECFIPHGGDDPDDDDNYSSNAHHARLNLRGAIESARIKRCNVKEDGSLDSSDGYGVELTLLINTKYGWQDLEKLCQVLSSRGCYVNKTCGLHIHFDMRNGNAGSAKARQFGKRIGAALPLLSQMLPQSRRNNRYCQLGVSKLRGDRYFAVNLTAFNKFRTVEVRLHSGTTSYSKIRNWIEVLQILGASRNRQPITDLQQLIDLNVMPERLIEYIDKRVTEFAGEARATAQEAS